MRAAIRVWCIVVVCYGSASAEPGARLGTCSRCDSVEVRHRGKPYWEPAGEAVLDGDWVRARGDAGIKLAGGGGLELTGSTTLFVEIDGKTARISILAGSATGKISGGDTPITVHTADGHIQIASAKPAEFQLVPAQEGVAALTVTKGELIVRTAGGVKKLGATEKPEPLPPPPTQPPPPKPPVAIKPPPPTATGKIATPQALAPRPEQHFRCLMLVEIPLRWQPIPGATGYKLLVTKNGAQVVENRELKKSAFTFTPPGPGIYIWRVAARDAKGYGDFSISRRVFCDK